MVEERSTSKKNIPFILRVIGIIALVITLVSVGAGLYKLFVYENSYDEEYMMDEEYLRIHNEEKGINSYNIMEVQDLTVNTGYATAYFTIAILFTILGIGAFVMAELVKRNEEIASTSESV